MNRNGNKIYILSRIEPLQEKQAVETSSYVNNDNSIDVITFKTSCDSETPTPVILHPTSEISLTHADKFDDSDDSDDSDTFDTFELNIMKEKEIPINGLENTILNSTSPIESEYDSGKCKGNRIEVIEMSEKVYGMISIDKKSVSRNIEINREQPSDNAVHKQSPIQGKGNSIAHDCIGKLSHL